MIKSFRNLKPSVWIQIYIAPHMHVCSIVGEELHLESCTWYYSHWVLLCARLLWRGTPMCYGYFIKRLQLSRFELLPRTCDQTLYDWSYDVTTMFCLFVFVFCPTREIFTRMETLPLPVRVCKFWPMVGTYCLWAVRHIYCDREHPLLMIISEDLWYSV